MSEISRVTRSKAEARSNYDKLSRWYDWLAGRTEKRYRDAALALLAPQAGERILEIGFGTGDSLCILAEAVGDGGHVEGIDLSEGMLAVTQKRLKKARLSPRATLHIADGAALPFEDQRFDAVFSSFVLELFDTPELPVVIAQCARVLKPGGRLAIASLHKPLEETWPVRLYEWFHRKMPRLVDCRPIRSRPLLEEAGFQILEDQRMVMWGLPVEILVAQVPQ